MKKKCKKQKYKTRKDAQKAAIRLEDKYGEILGSYKCTICPNSFHIGNTGMMLEWTLKERWN